MGAPLKPLAAYAALLGRQADGPLVTGVVNDSRLVLPGCVFVAIKGFKSDGHAYIPQAWRAGAVAVVCQTVPDERAPGAVYFQVDDPYRAYSRLVAFFHGDPAGKLKIAAVTGTNGKTSSAYLIQAALERCGRRCGLLSTVEYRHGHTSFPADRTTPEAGRLHELFAAMVSDGCTHVAMELSSHALHQDRLCGVELAATLFTNLTGDHLDYHGDMENYFQAKRVLFTELSGPGTAMVVNADDPYGARLLRDLDGKAKSFGRGEGADFRITDLVCAADGNRLRVAGCPLESNLAGEYNAYNVAGAFAVCRGLGLEAGEIARAFARPLRVPGRLELVIAPNGASFYVDYAHTDDALSKALAALKALRPARLVAVFGCGGDRDKTKRPRMAAAAAALADHVIVTSDNPRTEEPGKIIADIVPGFPPGASFQTIPDRGAAIAAAVRLANPGDIVLLAGKGHEDYQEIDGVKHPFDDVVELGKAFSSLAS